MENTSLSVFDPNVSEIYTSIQADNKESQKKLYNAMSAPDHRLSDYINKTIEVCDVIFEYINVTNKTTGEYQKAPRIVFIDKNGESYSCVSVGILNSIKFLFSVYGQPTWKDGIPIEIKQISRGENKILTISVK